MTDARGRSRKNNSDTGRVTFKKNPPLGVEGEKLRKKWDRMMPQERAIWLYKFDEYRKAHETKKGK